MAVFLLFYCRRISLGEGWRVKSPSRAERARLLSRGEESEARIGAGYPRWGYPARFENRQPEPSRF